MAILKNFWKVCNDVHRKWVLLCLRANVGLSRCTLWKKKRLEIQSVTAGVLGPVHTKTIVNANDSKRKLFYAFRPSVHTKTMKTLTVNA